MTQKILTTRNKTGEVSEKRFVGVNVPHDLYVYLSLYTASTGNTKSSLVNEILKERSKKVTSDELVACIVKRVERSWRILKPTMLFTKFKEELIKDFEKLHIPAYYQEVIITQIKE